MIRPRFQKVLSDLWGNRVRSFLVVASIAVGLFALGVMATIYIIAPTDMQRGYALLNPSHITFRMSLFEQGLIDRLARIPGVRNIEAMRLVTSRLQASPTEWVSIDIQSFKSPGDTQINKLHLDSGTLHPGDGEIILDRYKLPTTNAQLGDLVVIETPSGKNQSLKLVGIVQDQTIGAFRGAGGFFNAPVQGYVSQDTLETLEQPFPKRYDTLSVTTFSDGTDIKALEDLAGVLREEIQRNNITIYSITLRSSYEHPNLYLGSAVLAVLVVIGLLAVFMSGFLITNTLQAMLNQQVQQIGILKSIGARRIQIAAIYLLLNVFYGLLAFIISAPLSLQVAFWIIDFLTVQMNYTFYGLRIVPEVILVEALIAVLMPQVAAILPIWNGTQISVQEALSGIRQNKAPRHGSLDRLFSSLRRTSLLLVISLRNTFRRRGRLMMTVITLTLGGAIFIATFNVRISLTMYIDQIVQYFLADVNITLNRPFRIDEINGLIQQVPGVKMVEGWSFARTELVREDGSVGESVALLGPPVSSPLVKPILIEGRWIIPGDKNAIALSELFRERYPGLHVGDTIRLKVNGDETDWVVVGFYQLAGKISGFAAYTSYEYLTDLTNEEGRSASYRVVSTLPGLTRPQQLALGQAIEAHLEKSGIDVVDITTGQSLSDTASDGFDVLTAFLLFLSLLTALVGSIGLTGTMSLNVMERTREIGVLRAVGASDQVLLKLVLVEGALIGMLSWLLASLAAFPISDLMSDAISQSLFGGPANFAVTYTGFGLWLGAVVILAVIASIMPARNATRLTIREVLSYE